MVGTSIAENLARINESVAGAARAAGRSPDDVTLIAVSKTHPPEKIRQAFAVGARDFGENYWQEASTKLDALADLSARWHFIGALQSNKAKAVCGRFAWIHSVDRNSLIEALARAGESGACPQKIFLQVNLAEEASKGGCPPDEAPRLIDEIQRHAGLQLGGLMLMPPLDLTAEGSRPLFARLRELAHAWSGRLSGGHTLNQLSMGTSQDYLVAIAEGATMVRVGTQIFGARS